jgi:hypothetical protein
MMSNNGYKQEGRSLDMMAGHLVLMEIANVIPS